MSEVVVKTLDYLCEETKEVRGDAFLVNLVSKASSAEMADSWAQESDYPTHLCRQTRLLFQVKEKYLDSIRSIKYQ